MDDIVFLNIVLNFGKGLNHLWYEEFKNQLLDNEQWAFNNSSLIEKNHQLNVRDIYKQLYEFERSIELNVPSTITKTRDEGIIFTLLSYAEQNRPIIESIFTERTRIFNLKQKNYNPETEQIKEILSNKVRYQSDLLAFYMENYQNIDCYLALHSLFLTYMENLIRLNKYVDFNEYDSEKLKKLPNRYDNDYILHYLKLLIKHKDFDLAKKVYHQFPLTPTNKKETVAYENIKKKLNIN